MLEPHDYIGVGGSALVTVWGFYLLLTSHNVTVRLAGLLLLFYAGLVTTVFYFNAIDTGMDV